MTARPQLQWRRFDFLNSPADLQGQQGVYIIWLPGSGRRRREIRYVGQGHIRYRINYHRYNGVITAGTYNGRNLRVAWARINSQRRRDGVERFLADQLNPRFGDRYPNVDPIRVRLPVLR